jgi:hypothetical protein
MSVCKLIGKDDATALTGNWANIISADRFQCTTSGSCSEFRIKVTGNVNVKVAIYSDNSGTPNTRLAKKDAGTACTAGWNTITLESPVNLVVGTYYWLIVIFDANYGGYIASTGNGHKYVAKTYSGYSFPDPISESWTISNNYISLYAGWGTLILSPTSISQSIDHGLPELSFSLKPSGIAQPLSVGMPGIVTSAAVIYPSGIAQAVGIGTPSLIYPQVISPAVIAQPIAAGNPWLGIFGYIKPAGTGQQVSIGSPTLFKYVWHVILDGRYNIESPDKNRFYVIGRDQYGIPVYGTAVDSDEVGLVGERLDFQQELAIPTDSQAASMASALLSKMRLTGKRGFILIPPNCGQELFDVIQISDSGANQQAVSFRVVGIRFEYNTRVSLYRHQLLLVSP